MSYEDYKGYRKVIRSGADTSKEYHKGNLVQSINLCSKCGHVLSKLKVTDMRMIAVADYTRYGTGFMHYNLCKDSKRCYARYIERNNKGE